MTELPLCPSCRAPVSARATHCVLCDAPLVPVGSTSGALEAVSGYATDEHEIVRAELRPLLAQLSQALAPSIRITRLLGEGGMGLVFLGHDASLKRNVAIKVLSPALADDSVARARFTREAEAAAAVSHPSIVAVYQVGELPQSRIPFFVMQYVEGPTLADATGRVLPESLVRRLLVEIAGALAAAHRRKLVHRDVKPSNIVVDGESGRALVLDFGISAALSSRRKSRGVRLTTEGMYLGTPTYMSPEQASGDDITTKSDVYSLGILMYELLTGAPPFVGNALQVMAAQVKDRPPSLAERRPDLSAELVSLIERCLEKDPARRPAAQEIVNHLSAEAKHIIEWPPPGLTRLRRAGVRLLRTMAALTFAIVAFFTTMAVEPRAATPAHEAVQLFAQWRAIQSAPTMLRGRFSVQQSDLRETVAEAVAVWSFVLAAFVVLLLLFTVLMARRLDVATRFTGAARRSGYPWPVLLQVVGDGWPDTSELLNGMGAYAFVAEDERRRLLAWRRRAVVCLTVAFVLALGMFLLWIVSAFDRVAGETTLAVAPGEAFVIVAPPLLAVLAGALCLVPELRLRRTEGSLRRRQSTGSVNRELARSWLSSIGVAPAAARTPWSQTAVSFVTGILAVVVAASAVVVIAVVGDTTVRFITSRGRATEWVQEIASDSVHHMSWATVDSTLATAGHVAVAPAADAPSAARRFAAAFAEHNGHVAPLWIFSAADSAYALPRDRAILELPVHRALALMPSAAAGDTLAHTGDVPAPNRLGIFRELAHAPLEPFFWPYRTDAPVGMLPLDRPPFFWRDLRASALWNEYEGARALLVRDTATALLRARENIAVARQLSRAIGTTGPLTLVFVGHAGSELLRAAGRVGHDAALVALADSTDRALDAMHSSIVMNPSRALAFFADPNDATGVELIGDRRLPPEGRVRLLSGIFYGQCVNSREMLLGVSQRREALFDSAAVRLRDVPRAAEVASQWRAFMSEWRDSPSRAMVRARQRAVGAEGQAAPAFPLGGLAARAMFCFGVY